MANQEDIGNQLRPIIGDALATSLILALKEHIRLAGEVIKAAAKSGDKRLLANNIQLLFESAKEVSELLSDIKLEEISIMFAEHNQFVIDMTMARLRKEHKREIELLNMSDMIVSNLY